MSQRILTEIRVLERELSRIPDDVEHQRQINELIDQLMEVMGFVKPKARIGKRVVVA